MSELTNAHYDFMSYDYLDELKRIFEKAGDLQLQKKVLTAVF